MPSIYLCGPINGCTDDEAKGWRAVAAEVLLAGDWTVFDPMARDYRGMESQPGIAQMIVEQDKADIDACSDLLVMFDKPSVGTSMKVLYAWERGKPVHVVNLSRKPLSPWLKYHASSVHDDLRSALYDLTGQY